MHFVKYKCLWVCPKLKSLLQRFENEMYLINGFGYWLRSGVLGVSVRTRQPGQAGLGGRHTEYHKIVDLLTNKKGKWHSTSKDQHKEIFRSSLTEEAKVWFYFLASTLLPSKHLTIVSRKEAILLYSLLKGYKMNVGKIIEESILDYFNSKYRGYLPHPAIVTKLCSIQELSYN